MIITLILLTYTKVNLNFWNWNVIQVPDLIYYIWQPQDGKPLHNIHFPSSLHTGAINLVAPCPVGTTYWKKQQQDYSVTICQQWDRGYTPKTTHNTAIYQHEFDEGKLTENWETEKLRTENWEKNFIIICWEQTNPYWFFCSAVKIKVPVVLVI